MERNDLDKWDPRELADLLALAESERKYYQGIVAGLPVGLVVLSKDLSVISANRSILEIFDIQKLDSLRGRLDDLRPAGLDDQVREVLRTGIPLNGRLMFSNAKGGRRVRVGIQALLHFSRSPLEALLTVEDVTDLVRPVAAHSRDESKLAAGEILENLGATVWVVEIPQMRFVFVNEAGRRLLGFDIANWLGNSEFWSGRIHSADRERVAETYRAGLEPLASHDRGISCEYRAKTSSEKTIWLYETARVIVDSEGHPRYLTGVTVDITERRRLERQLVQSNRRHAIGKLAGRLVHDLNNLLMIVTGFGEELLGSFPIDSPLRQDIQQILKAGERVGALTQQLLALSRTQPASPTTVELGAVLQSMEINVRKDLGDNIELDFQPIQHRIAVAVDSMHFQQVVSTLARRARLMMPSGGLISIRVKQTEITGDCYRSNAPLLPGPYAIVEIQDEGPQYDPEARSLVFESVLPGDEKHPEIGPLLSQAYALTRQWGGDISVEASAARGEIFQIFLPIVAEPRPAAARFTKQNQGAKQETILVVDDEEGIRMLICKILRHQGFRVLEAKSGPQAIELFRTQRDAVGLVIADVAMPEMNGPQLIANLQRFQNEIRVLYISGYTADTTLSIEDLPPDVAFLRKPFTLAALLDKVGEMIAAKRPAT